MSLPVDPIMLLSVVNLKLRDQYKDLDALCEDLEADKAGLCAKLHAVGYDCLLYTSPSPRDRG